jgi:hypothetical protein
VKKRVGWGLSCRIPFRDYTAVLLGVGSICVRFPGLLFLSLYATWVVSPGVSVCALWSSPVGEGENDRCVRKLVYISGVGGDIYVCGSVGGWL